MNHFAASRMPRPEPVTAADIPSTPPPAPVSYLRIDGPVTPSQWDAVRDAFQKSKTLTDALFAVMPPEASDVAKWRAVDDIVRTEQMQAIRQLIRDHVPVKHIPAELVGWVVNG